MAEADDAVVVLDEDGGPAGTRGDDVGVPVLREDKEPAGGLPKGAKELDDGRVRLPLLYPVTLRYKKPGSDAVREETYGELVFGRLHGADVEAIAASGSSAFLVTGIARSTRMHVAKMKLVFAQMDARDINAAARVFDHFFGSGQTTGQ